MISVIQQKFQKSYVGDVELNKKLDELDTYICLLQEPYCYKGKLAGLPQGTKVIPSPTVVELPRASLITSSDLSTTELAHLCGTDLAVGQIDIGDKHIVMASLYMDINEPLHSFELERLLKYCSDRQLDLLLFADTNAHSTLFGPKQNPRGDELECILARYGLEIANNSHVPTFRTVRAESCIDCTLHVRLPVEIKDWRVDPSYDGSDHSTISFELNASSAKKEKIRNWDKADWDLFTDTLRLDSFHIPQVIDQRKLDKLVSKLYNRLNNALDLACPLHEVGNKIQVNKWYDSSLEQLSRRVAKAYKKSCSSGLEHDRVKFRELANKYKKACVKKKREAWQDFISTPNSAKSTARFVKILKGEKRAQVGTLKKANGTMTDPGEETLDLLLIHTSLQRLNRHPLDIILEKRSRPGS